ncbi:MAG: hypothetical protein F8N36_02060 [Desulfovibrio sp.]|nr:hypothetical protein [Desulfovibrio sp.]
MVWPGRLLFCAHFSFFAPWFATSSPPISDFFPSLAGQAAGNLRATRWKSRVEICLFWPKIAAQIQADKIQISKYVLFIKQTVWQFFANMLTQECT